MHVYIHECQHVGDLQRNFEATTQVNPARGGSSIYLGALIAQSFEVVQLAYFFSKL